MNLPKGSTLLSIQEAASFLGVSTKTLRRWETTGALLPTRTSGGHRRYMISELKWVKKNGAKKPVKAIKEATTPISAAAAKSYYVEPVASFTPVVQPVYEPVPVPISIEPTKTEFRKPQKPKSRKKLSNKNMFRFAVVVLLFLIFSSNLKTPSINLPNLSTIANKIKSALVASSPKLASLKSNPQVLAEETTLESVTLQTNVPAVFEADVTINGNVLSEQAEISLFPDTVTQINIGGTEGTTSINNNLDVNGTNNDIAGTLNLSGNILASSADLTIDATGGGVKIGTGTPGTVDLAGDDLYVTGDLEVDGIAYIPTLSINSDNFTDLTGTGLQISSGSLQATLGTSISSSELEDSAVTTAKINNDAVTSAKIADGSILEIDLSATNDPTNAYMLTYDSATGGFTWVDPSASSGAWADDGTLVRLTTSTDNVTIGSATQLAKLGIDGDTDEIQFLVQGVAGQSVSHIVVENSSGTDLFTVASNGNVDTAGDYTMNSSDPTVFFNDETAASDDYYISVDASIMTLTNSTDARNEILFNGSGSIDIGDNTATKTIDIGGVGSSAADTIRIATNSTAADTITIGNSNTSTTVAITGGDDWSMTATGLLTMTPSANSDALSITGTSVTSENLISLDSRNTSGTIFNMFYGSSTTLTGSLIGQSIDFNSGNVTATNQDVTGANIKLPTVTDTETSGTNTLTGLLVNFGAGAGINQNGAGGTLEYIAGDFRMPALTQTAGTLNAYGVQVVTPSSITTGGTAYGVNVSATGVGAGTLAGVNIGSITAGAGTEYAIQVGTGWDAVLRVGSTTVINGSGVTQEAGGGTSESTYTTGDILYASATNTLDKLAIGASDGYVLQVSSGVPVWGTVTGSSCTNCLINNPTSDQNISPTGQGTTGLSVRQTSTASPNDDIFRVTSSDGATKYFYVDSSGNVSTGAISNTTLTLTPTTNTTALTLVGTNVTTATNQYINTRNVSGSLVDISYGGATTLTAGGTLQALDVDLSTNVTATNANVYGGAIVLPGTTNTHTSGTRTIAGLSVTAGGGINQNGAGGTTVFAGTDITIPALTQTAGTLTAYGENITLPSSITTGGTASGVNINATGISVGTITGVNIGAISSAGAGTEYGLVIGSGWDRNLYFNDTTTSILAADGATITITDGTNTLCTITDSGTTGDLSCTGNITGSGSGTSGFWSRSGTNLSPATAGDDVLLPDSDTIQFGTGVDSSITYDGTNLVIDPDLVGTGTVRIAGTEGADKLTVTAGDVNVSDGSVSITDDDNAVSLALTNNTADTIGASAATGLADFASTSLTTGTLLNLELTEGTLNGGHYLKAWDATAAGTVFSVGEDGNTTIAGAGGSTVFTITAGDAVLSDGSISITDADNAASFALTNNTADTIGASAATGIADLASTSLTTGTLLNLELTEGTLNGGHYLKAWDATGAGTVFSVGEDGATAITGLEGSNMLTVTAGDAVISDGSMLITDDDDAVSFGVTNNTATTIGVGVNTAGVVDISSTSLTTGNLLNLETTTALTSGRVLNVSSTTTSSSFSGNLGRFSWEPGSATVASADLFLISISSNGTTTGDLFDIQDNSSSLFKVSETAIVSALPHSFTAAGDVAVAYDLQFTNQTSSSIKSFGPLTIESGESFENNNLTLKTYGNGKIISDGGFSLNTQESLPADDTTPSVGGASFYLENNTTNTVVTNFDDGTAGQIIVMEITDTDIDFDCSSNANFNCGTTDLTTAAGDTLTWIYDGTQWSLISYMDNAQDNNDLAEWFPTNGEIAAGEVVSIDGSDPVKVQRSVESDGQRVIGIISTEPGLILGQASQGVPSARVALAGRVPVKVDPTSEAIGNGDLLGASSTLGMAKKVNSGWVIGRALETWTPDSGQETVMVFVNSIYVNDSQLAQNPGDTELLLGQEASGSANLTDLTLNNLTVLADAILPDTVINGKLNIGSMVLDNINSSIDAVGVLKIQPLALDDIEFLSGLIIFDKNGNIKAQSIEVAKIAIKGASAGTSTLPANETEIFIDTDQVKTNSLVFVTPKATLAYPLAVVELQDGIGFKVKVQQSESNDIEFDWFIVDHTEE